MIHAAVFAFGIPVPVPAQQLRAHAEDRPEDEAVEAVRAQAGRAAHSVQEALRPQAVQQLIAAGVASAVTGITRTFRPVSAASARTRGQ